MSFLRRILWLGRGTATMMGVAVVLAVVLGLATTALAAVPGDPFKLGKLNAVDKITQLIGTTDNAMLRVDNNSSGANATALDLQVEPGKAPMKVDSNTTVASLSADQLDGKDFTAFDVEEVIENSGPLPLERTFTSEGGTLVLFVSGSGYRGTGSSRLEGNIGMNVYIDGTRYGTAYVYTNERNSHKAFISGVEVVRGLPAGVHTIRLDRIYAESFCNTTQENQPTYCTATDGNDKFRVAVMELPAEV